MERHDAPRSNRDFFAGLGIPPGTLRFVTQLEISEAGQFHALTMLQLCTYFLKKGFHHIFGFTFIEAYLVKK